MEKCTKCGLDENYAGIKIENGVCNYCSFFEKQRKTLENYDRLEDDFIRKIEQAKRKAKEAGSKYDCLVGFSGGKDSSYIIYQLQKKYGMRVLAFTFDNGFTTEYGKNNIKNALSKLSVDYVTFSLNKNTLSRQYTTCMNLTHNFCAVCFHNMHYYSYHFAALNKIPLIVNGRTRGQILQCADSEKGIEPFEASYKLIDFEYQMFKGLEKRAARMKWLDYLDDVEVEAISYFAYHNVSEEETMKFLEEKIGWERPKGSKRHADCMAHEMAEYLHIKKHGYPIRTGELAVLVREGKLTVEEAQKQKEEDIRKFSEISQDEIVKFYDKISFKPNEKVE